MIKNINFFQNSNMIRNLFIYLFLLPAFFLSCKNDKESGPIDEGTLQLSYSKSQKSEKHVISEKDTITLDIGDTLLVYVSTTSKFIGIFGDTNFEMQDKGNKEYYGIAKKTGVASVGAFAEREDATDLEVSFFIKIPSLIYEYIVVENLSSTVDVENEALKEIIQTELGKSYIPARFTDYRLKCDTVNGGDLLLYKYSSGSTSSDTIRGKFTTPDIKEMANMTMSYSGSTYYFTSKKDTLGEKFYIFKQDLTKEFRVKYPLETIREVAVNSLSIRYYRKE
jgi:hypothetical protein